MPVAVIAALLGASGPAAAAAAGGCQESVSRPGSEVFASTCTRYSVPATASNVTDDVRTSPSSSLVATGVSRLLPGYTVSTVSSSLPCVEKLIGPDSGAVQRQNIDRAVASGPSGPASPGAKFAATSWPTVPPMATLSASASPTTSVSWDVPAPVGTPGSAVPIPTSARAPATAAAVATAQRRRAMPGDPRSGEVCGMSCVLLLAWRSRLRRHRVTAAPRPHPLPRPNHAPPGQGAQTHRRPPELRAGEVGRSDPVTPQRAPSRVFHPSRPPGHAGPGSSVGGHPDRLHQRTVMRISVVGCGYLGAVHAASMASLGHDVVGIDVDVDKVASLMDARAPFFEPGLPELLDQEVSRGALEFTTDVARAAGSRVHFLCVGTPQRPGEYAADLRYVDAAVESLLPHLAPGDVVVGKSTVPVGTALRLSARVREAQPDAHLVWNPEFLREGHAVQDTLHPDRLVYGLGPDAGEVPERVLDEVYAQILADGTPKVVTDFATAELVKVAANSFLATKISFINAM